MPGALASVLRLAPLTPEKVAFAWRTRWAPPSIAPRRRASRVHARGRGQERQWRHESPDRSALIRSRLNFVLGDGVVARSSVQSEGAR
jgi:hypothetical protein